MQIQAFPASFPTICPSPEEFFSGKVSKNLGYLPAIGTVIGLSRIIFSSYHYFSAFPGWPKERFVQEIFRGVLEALWLGPALFVYEHFFAKVQPISTTSFAFLNSTSFTDHAVPLVAHYASKLPTVEQLSRYQTYVSHGPHAWQNQNLFHGADYYARHGVMHACFVSLFIPVFLSLYRQAGHPEASQLTPEDVLGLQVAGFFHDYGRILAGKDLTGDNEQMESMGEEAAYRYMKDAMSFSEERARRLSHCIMAKDAPVQGKPLIQQLLQNCDSLAVLRADDWIYDPNYLDLIRWARSNLPEGPARQNILEELHQVIDAAKSMLVNMGDSPYSMPCFSQARQGQVIRGHFSLSAKRIYEKSPHCYQMMRQLMINNPILACYAS